MICPNCSTAGISVASDSKYAIVTYNPTTPYLDGVMEFECSACKYRWFSLTVADTAANMLPTLVITSVTGGSFNAATNELTISAGTSFTANAELHFDGNLFSLFSGVFRMPVASQDGREKLLLATVNNGLATISWTPKDSGIWNISASLINRDLPENQHLAFLGLKIFVID